MRYFTLKLEFFSNILPVLVDVYLNKKGQYVKIQLLNIFKDHNTVAQSNPIAVGYNKWPLSNFLWMEFYISHGKYKPELNEYLLIPAKFCNVLFYKCA